MAEIATIVVWLLLLLKAQKQKPSKTTKAPDAPKAPPSAFVTNREMTFRDEMDARFGRGKFVGKTGNPFIDDPFFNPWAPGGDFNK